MAVATVALVLLLITITSPGFLVSIGSWRLSVRRWQGPLELAALSWLLGLAVYGRRSLESAAADLLAFIERHAVAMVIVLASCSVATGIAFGTYAAAGSDAAGYVNEAELFFSGRVAEAQPLIDQVSWPDAAWSFAPLGTRPSSRDGELAPTYPPGLPLVMSMFLPIDAWTVFLVVPVLGGLAVGATYAIGQHLHSRAAGVGAAALLATSPIFLFQIVQPMSDVAVTAWWALAIALALKSSPKAAFAAGAATGVALLTRPNLALVGVAVLVALLGERRQLAKLMRFTIGVTPAILLLLSLQFRLYGSPVASGYGPFDTLFAWSNVQPNLLAYASRLLHGERGALLLAGLAAALVGARLLRPTVFQTGFNRSAWFVLWTVALVLASYLPYGQFSEWFYLRFLLPAFPVALALVAALTLSAISVLPPSLRGLAFVAALTLVASDNIKTADREQAFHLREFEARYRLAGQYLAASLPSNAVVIASQQSASAHYYTHLPILRWDLLTSSLDAAVAELRSAGRSPVVLIEDWELSTLRDRFPAFVATMLETGPVAEIIGATRVGVFDLSRRASPAGAGSSDPTVVDVLSFQPEAHNRQPTGARAWWQRQD